MEVGRELLRSLELLEVLRLLNFRHDLLVRIAVVVLVQDRVSLL